MWRFIKTLAILLVVLGGTMSALPAGGKCDGDQEYQDGLKKIGSDYRVIKDFRVTLKGGDPKAAPELAFPISLTQGLKYKFMPVNNPENETKMIMRIFMSRNKEMMVATTFNSSVNKHYPAMEFECHRSGTYYLFFTFDSAKKGCGVGLFAVSK